MRWGKMMEERPSRPNCAVQLRNPAWSTAAALIDNTPQITLLERVTPKYLLVHSLLPARSGSYPLTFNSYWQCGKPSTKVTQWYNR